MPVATSTPNGSHQDTLMFKVSASGLKWRDAAQGLLYSSEDVHVIVFLYSCYTLYTPPGPIAPKPAREILNRIGQCPSVETTPLGFTVVIALGIVPQILSPSRSPNRRDCPGA